jgi:hypothetical protein
MGEIVVGIGTGIRSDSCSRSIGRYMFGVRRKRKLMRLNEDAHVVMSLLESY